MRHEWMPKVVVDGFVTGEVDFAARLAASSQSVRDDFDNNVMSPLVNGLDGAMLVISGHSDRVDTGESHQVCLQNETRTSAQRASSADATVFAKFAEWLDPAPTSWDELPHVSSYTYSNGAVLLAVEPTDEASRLRNRRVELQVCRFVPDE